VANTTLEFLKYDLISTLRNNFIGVTQLEKDILTKLIFNMTTDLKKIANSRSQLGQDYLAQASIGNTSSGFFVEIGGGDPIIASNSYLLQKSFKWRGIIVEPNPELIKKTLEIRCQNEEVSVYPFALSKNNGYENFLPSGMLGTFERYIDGDFHSEQRNKLKKSKGVIQVETKTPATFIKDCDISIIDFMSIDTEGSEWEIIVNWPFDVIQPKVICIEVNDRGSELDILNFLEGKKYVNVLRRISKYDLWFVLDPDSK
jgi:FkbM family methyltransferase